MRRARAQLQESAHSSRKRGVALHRRLTIIQTQNLCVGPRASGAEGKAVSRLYEYVASQRGG